MVQLFTNRCYLSVFADSLQMVRIFFQIYLLFQIIHHVLSVNNFIGLQCVQNMNLKLFYMSICHCWLKYVISATVPRSKLV